MSEHNKNNIPDLFWGRSRSFEPLQTPFDYRAYSWMVQSPEAIISLKTFHEISPQKVVDILATTCVEGEGLDSEMDAEALDYIHLVLKILEAYNKTAAGILEGAVSRTGSVDSPEFLKKWCYDRISLRRALLLTALEEEESQLNAYCTDGSRLRSLSMRIDKLLNFINPVIEKQDSGQSLDLDKASVIAKLKANHNFNPDLPDYTEILMVVGINPKADGINPPQGIFNRLRLFSMPAIMSIKSLTLFRV